MIFLFISFSPLAPLFPLPHLLLFISSKVLSSFPRVMPELVLTEYSISQARTKVVTREMQIGFIEIANK